MIKKMIIITPFFILSALAVVIIAVNVDGTDSAITHESITDSKSKGTPSKVLERKPTNTEYPDFKSYVYVTYEKWNNLSSEDKYAQGLGDETYQLLQTTISETSRWQADIEIYGESSEFISLNETARNLTSPLAEYTDEERADMISWFDKLLEDAYIKVKNMP